MKSLALIFTLISTLAVASNHYPLIVYEDNLYQEKIFVLHQGGCLIGPLEVFNSKGKLMFNLEKDSKFGDCK